MRHTGQADIQRRVAAQAHIGTADVKPQRGGRSHKPRNLAKSVTVE